MVFSWLQNLKQGLIRGKKHQRSGVTRGKKMSRFARPSSSFIVESLEPRQMLSANPIPAGISEIMIDPPGGGTSNQYIELRGTPNATLANGTYLVGVSGVAATAGNVQDIFNLSGLQFGSNGFLVIAQKGETYSVNGSATLRVNSGTGAGFGSDATSSVGHSGISNNLTDGSATYFLMTSNTAPTLATTIDAAKNGTNGAAGLGWTILDSVGVRDNSSDYAYGQINFQNSAGGTSLPGTVVTVGFTPAYVARMETSTGYADSASNPVLHDWVAAGSLSGSAPNFSFSSTVANSSVNVASVAINNIGSYNKYGGGSSGVDSAPVFGSGITKNFTENGIAANLDTSISITDADGTSTSTKSGLLTVTNFVAGEDFLSYSTTAGITGVVDNTNGTITFTAAGGAPLSSWQGALTSVRYQDTSDNPISPDRTVVYQVNDGTYNSPPMVVTIHVIAVNDGPGINAPGAQTTLESTAKTITGLSFTDVDANSGTETVTLSVSHGALSVSTSVGNGLTAAMISGNGTGSVTINATLSAINATFANASGLTYTPTQYYNGSDSLSIGINDNGNTGGGALTASASVGITVTSVNSAPSGTSNSITLNEDKPYTFTAADFGFSDAHDTPANALSAVKITSITGGGSLTDNGTAVTNGQQVAVADITGGKLVFTPAANANGAAYASFLFQVVDDGGTANGGVNTDPSAKSMTINVNTINDAPVGVSKTVTTLEDAAYTFTTADFGFSDPNDTPANNFQAVKIGTISGAGSLTDNGVAVSANQVIPVADISGGKLVFTPVANANGASYASFTFQVQDDGGTANGGVDTDPTARTMTVNVTSVNDAPSGASKTVTTLEDTAYTFAVADFGFTDSSDSPPNNFAVVKIGTISGAGALTDNGTAVSAGQLVPVSDISGGKLVFTPAANANGSAYASFTFQVQDDGGTANGGVNTDPTARTMTVNVTSVNDAPSGASKTVTTLEDTPYTFAIADFGFTDANDSPANNFTAVKINTISGGGTLADNGITVTAGQLVSLSDISGGKLILTPAANANGTAYASFTFQVQDDGGTSNGGSNTDPTSRTMTVNVTPVNDAPVLSGVEGSTLIYSGKGSVQVTATLTASDVDSPNLASATVKIASGYQNGTDSLSFTNTATLTGNWNASTGTLTITGADTPAKYQAALRSVQFTNSGSSTAARTISFVVNDGSLNSNSVSRVVDVVPQVLSLTPLSPNPGSGSSVQFGLTFSEPVTGVAASAFALSESGVTGGVINVSGSGANYTLTVAGLSGNGIVGVNLTNLSGIADAGGNGLSTGFTGSFETLLQPGGPVQLVGTALTMNGTSSDDVISVTEGALLDVRLNGAIFLFNPAAVTSIALNGNAGNDSITVNSLNVGTALTANGGDGNDTITVNASVVTATTLVGGNGNDTLTGGSGNDSLQGGTGTNVLNGGDGNDNYILAVRTFADKDTIVDSSGSDSLSFASFTNGLTLNLQTVGAQTIDAVSGYQVDLQGVFETLSMGTGNDVVTGNATVGTTIYGGNGNNTLTGGSGNDVLVGGTGNDTLLGLGGNDQLQGGTGNNVLNGGDGSDTYVPAARTSADKDTIVDSSGTDSLLFAAFTNNLSLNLQTVGPQTIDAVSGYQVDLQGTFESVTLGSGNDTVTGNATIGTTLIGGAGNDTLIGGSGNDLLQGGTGTNVLNGGDGNDSYTLAVRTSADKDTIIDSSGVDNLSFGAFTNNLSLNLQTVGPQTIDAVAGYQVDLQGVFESVTLGSGNDIATGNATVGTTLNGGAGNDTLIGGSGNDSLQGGTGTNVLNGGAGNDTYTLSVRTSAEKDTIVDSSGADSLSFASFTNGLTLNLQTAGAQTIDSLSGYQVDLQGVFETVSTGSGSDVVTGNATVGTSIYGGNGNNTLTGGSGNDVLVGGTGNDILNGMGGNDSLSGGTGTNTLNGGDGNDTYTLAARTVAEKDTIVDSSGTDSLSFGAFTNNLSVNLQTVGPQTIDAVSGYQVDLQGTFETVTLGSGNDTATGNASIGTTLIGGAGNDTLIGGSGNDSLQGGTGTNVLNGADGNDSYTLAARTSADKDTIIDSSGTDNLSFAAFTNDLNFSLQTVGNQTADATSGYQIDLQGTFESVSLGSGNDTVTGNATIGTTLNGGAGNDTLIGGSGNDVLQGGTGTNVLNGGDGNDTYVLAARTSAEKDTIIDSSGADTLSFAAFTNDLNFSLQTSGNQTADAATGYQIIVQGVFETLLLGSGNEVVTGNATVSTTIYGGNGNNTLTGGSGNDILVGGTGNDILNGMGGNDSLSGGTGTNTLNGGDGNDTYTLAARTVAEKDTIVDSSGTDSLSFGAFTNNLSVNLQTVGPQTIDAVSGYQVDLQGTFETVTLGSGNDTATGNASIGTTLIGGAGNDTLIGGSGNDSLQGGTGTNVLNGADGNDSYTLAARTSADKDTIIDSSGSDNLSFSAFTNNLSFNLQVIGNQTADAISGYQINLQGTFESVSLGSGNDTVTGNATIGTTLNGGAGNDTLIGGSGNDVLQGGTGTNVLNGGDGSDTYVLAARTSAEKDTIVDSSGSDSLSFAAFTNGLTLNLQTVGAQTIDSVSGYQVDLQGVFETVSTGSGNDVVTGNAIVGTSIYGGNGNNTLTGGSGNDILVGGTGNDILNGLGGNDSLSGGTGMNVLTGGDGNDSYALAARTGAEKDTIIDSTGVDNLSFGAFTNNLSLNLQTVGPQTIDAVSGYQVDLQGTFESVTLGSGNDTATGNATIGTTLIGGAGNDTLIGGSGNDSLQGGTGINVLNGGDGNDSYTLAARTSADKDTIIDSSGTDSLSFAAFTNGLTLNLQTVGAQMIDSVSGYQVDLQGVFETVSMGTGDDAVTGNATVGTTIYGGNGNNTLTGGSGNDVLVGGTGNDTLLGLGGNDQLQGGTGTNVLNGGDGNDTYVSAARTSAEKDTIVDSSGTDSLLFAAFTNNLTLNLQTVGPQTIDAVSGYQVDLQGTFETVTLGSGNDTATGNASVGTTIYGGSGNNTLTGGSGNDVLVGGVGNDTLIGLGGNDTLQGGAGTNILNGGDGNDNYSLAARTAADKDTIIDSSGTDSLSFTSFMNGLVFSLQTVGPQTADAASGYQIDLQGTFETVSLGSGNNVVTGNATVGTTIIGGAGTNILIGGSGNDTLIGGGANDILIGGLGTDTLTGNANDDILIGGTLSFANNLAGLLAIQQEWTSANSYTTRVANLKGAPGGQNGAFFLNSSTVTLGTAKDTLTGGAGNDWFWANAIDTKDLVAGEQLN